MSETATREDRRSRLDEFANSSSTGNSQEGGAMVPASVGAQQSNLVFGAQAVAVRRDEASVLRKIKVLASAAGTDWYYRFPVKNRKENRTDWIEGPSIKLANDLARLYGNCEVDCRAQDLGNVILYHARFVDLETGYALTRPFQQRKGAAKLGGSDDQRREDITFQIGASKAIRNVVVNALQTFADFAFEEAKEALVGRIGGDIEKWRRNTAERIGLKVDLKRVEAVVGRAADQWLAPDIARIIAMGKAAEDGMATWDETFPPLTLQEQAAPAGDQGKHRLDDFADEKTMVNGNTAEPARSGGETAAASPEPPSPSQAAAVDDDPHAGIIERMLQLAEEDRPAEERLERLDVAVHDFLDQSPKLATFIKLSGKTAASVAKGEMPVEQAREYLEAAK
ncbi:hypothetical protein NKJ06_18915 [Mesorhizobium sp. M0293]|uniref:hypothetical protein n=1 Tax=Mesorhizobium sp. M0293 TaxID=2956930 RepID=UPI0033393D6B